MPVRTVQRLDLRPLDADETAELVARSVGAPPGEKLAAALTRANGNPLLVLAVVDALMASGALEVADGLADVAGPIPELRASATITARLGEVSADVLRSLQAAAVLGPNIAATDLTAMTGRPAVDLLDDLEASCDAGLLVHDGDSYAFRHELHRVAVLDTVPDPIRSALHLDAARALAQIGAPVVDVAEQFARGARPGNREAVTWLERAASDVVEHAPAVALRLLDVALRLSGTTPPPELLLARVRALAATGQMAEAEALARTLLREGLDEPTEAQLHRQLALVYLVQGRSSESVAAIERYGELLHEPSLRGRTQAEIAFTRFVDLDHDGARAAAQLAIEEGERVGDLAAQVAGGGVLCWLDEFRNRFPAALERVAQILTMAEQPNAIESHLYQPWFMAALVHLESDRLEDLAHDVRRGREIAESTGFAWSIPGYDAMAAYGLVRSGDLDDAAAIASSTLGYLDGVDGWGVALWCHAFLAQIAIHRGDDSTGDEHVAIAEQYLTTGRGQFGFEQSMIAKARLAERRNDPSGALQILGDTWDVYGAIGVLAGRQAIGPDLVRLSTEAGDLARY